MKTFQSVRSLGMVVSSRVGVLVNKTGAGVLSSLGGGVLVLNETTRKVVLL